jgi:hypothetical protein
MANLLQSSEISNLEIFTQFLKTEKFIHLFSENDDQKLTISRREFESFLIDDERLLMCMETFSPTLGEYVQTYKNVPFWVYYENNPIECILQDVKDFILSN